MAKKKSEDKTKEKKEKTKEVKSKEKKPMEFNLSDGFTYHDFVGLLILIGSFLLGVLRLILAPVFWVIGENARMIRFIRAKGHERVMTEDERYFVESIPFLYTASGLIGGLIVGLFAVFTWGDVITAFFKDLDIVKFFDSIFKAIFGVFGWIWNGLVWIVTGVGNVFGWIESFIKDLFDMNPFIAFLILATIGIIVIILWITLVEKGVFTVVIEYLKAFIEWFVGSPDRFRFKVTNYYRRMNHWLTAKLVGQDRLHTRTQIYFKKSILYTLFGSIYSFGAGIYVGTNPDNYGELQTPWSKIFFIATVLFVAGIVSGTVFFALISRVYDALNRAKYISPEFKEEGTVNEELLNQASKSTEDKIRADLTPPVVEKPWKERAKKKKEDTGKKPSKTEKETVDDTSSDVEGTDES
ncbi:MAG: hypothetical protein OEZ01_08925 [Candidatus Heimdallarchaeota archaeon]|nr:hypothetical protein [Candidatus Heimdallarchaeota archaeon]